MYIRKVNCNQVLNWIDISVKLYEQFFRKILENNLVFRISLKNKKEEKIHAFMDLKVEKNGKF